MSNLQKNPKDPLVLADQSELFVDLSEQDQETVSAGFGLTFLYLQKEVISATSSNDTEIEGLGGSGGVPLTGGRTSQRATYDSTRTTFAIGGLIPINSVASFISNIIHLF